MVPASRPLATLVETMEAGTRPGGGASVGNDGLPSLGGENVTRNGLLAVDTFRTVPESFFRSMKRGVLRPGDVVINKDGAQTGKVARYMGEFESAAINEHLFLLRPKSGECDPSYLYWLLLARRTQIQIARFITGSAQPGLAQSFLHGVLVPHVALNAQRRMADVLDACQGEILDSTRLIRKLSRLRLAVLEERLQASRTSEGTRSLQFLTTKIVDGVHHTPTYVRRGVPFLTVENLTRGVGISLDPVRYVSTRAHAEYRRRIEPLPGDVLVSKDGTLGIARVVPDKFPEASVFVSVAVLRPIQSLVLPDFLRLFFDTEDFRRQLRRLSAGSGLQHIHLEHFRAFALPDLEIAQQAEVVEAVRVIDERLQAEESVRAKLVAQQVGLIESFLSTGGLPMGGAK